MGETDYKRTYALFLDESGHDHKTMPYEVRGGIALPVDQAWSFVNKMITLEHFAFGDLLHKYGSEIKGHKLLNKERFRWAVQAPEFSDGDRQYYARSFLRGRSQKKTRPQFTAYGQACILMAKGIFKLLQEHEAVLFAGAIPCGIKKDRNVRAVELLRKDQVFLLERYYYFLEEKESIGLIVADESDRADDRRFFGKLQRYFTKTFIGGQRVTRIVPVPLFVASDMSYPVQAADVCIYCVNLGFRLPSRGMNAQTRPEVAKEFGPLIQALQFARKIVRPGEVFETFSIFYVPDPYSSRD